MIYFLIILAVSWFVWSVYLGFCWGKDWIKDYQTKPLKRPLVFLVSFFLALFWPFLEGL